jgi:hypothetical protein
MPLHGKNGFSFSREEAKLKQWCGQPLARELFHAEEASVVGRA